MTPKNNISSKNIKFGLLVVVVVAVVVVVLAVVVAVIIAGPGLFLSHPDHRSLHNLQFHFPESRPLLQVWDC